MRLSRPRVLLRAALLVVGAGFMLVKASEAWSSAGEGGAQAVLLRRIAAVEALVGLLALAAAVVALLALRPRRRAHTLRLGDLPPARPDRPSGADGRPARTGAGASESSRGPGGSPLDR